MEEKVLIVDDAMFMRRVVRKNLEECGFVNILEAGDGEEALRIYRREKPALVMLDITMPGMSGLEVLEQIRSEDQVTKVIMCSAVGQESMIQRAVVAGAEDFIVKPFRAEEFRKIVQNVMER